MFVLSLLLTALLLPHHLVCATYTGEVEWEFVSFDVALTYASSDFPACNDSSSCEPQPGAYVVSRTMTPSYDHRSLYLFGGLHATSNDLVSDLWYLDMSATLPQYTWTFLGSNPDGTDAPTSGNETALTNLWPGGRMNAGLWALDETTLIHFGGHGRAMASPEGKLHNIWFFNTNTSSWIFPPEVIPSPDALKWYDLDSSSNGYVFPASRDQFLGWLNEGLLHIIGGKGDGVVLPTLLWTFDPNSLSWSNLTLNVSDPSLFPLTIDSRPHWSLANRIYFVDEDCGVWMYEHITMGRETYIPMWVLQFQASSVQKCQFASYLTDPEPISRTIEHAIGSSLGRLHGVSIAGLFFGGIPTAAAGTVLADIWLWNLHGPNVWSYVDVLGFASGTGQTWLPAARKHHSYGITLDEDRNMYYWVFGGRDAGDTTRYGNLYRLKVFDAATGGVWCGGVPWWDESVCGGSGICVARDTCQCLHPARAGPRCAVCDDPAMVKYKTCGNNGWCEGTACVCRAGFIGGKCQITLFVVILAAVIPTFVVVIVVIGVTIGVCRVIRHYRIKKKKEMKKRKKRAKKNWKLLREDMGVPSSSSSSSEEEDNEYRDKLRSFRKDEMELAENEELARLNINKSLFEIAYSDLKISKKIGSGGSAAIVFSAEWAGKPVAFKCFKMQDFLEENRFMEFEREVELLASLSHPAILRFYGATIHPPRVGIVMELCPNGDLHEYVLSSECSRAVRMRLCHETCLGMGFLHTKKLLHRDLKAENILISKHIEARICDFGISRIIADAGDTRTRAIGTSFYMAPELFAGHYGFPVDVFAFGILLYCTLTANFRPYGDDALHPEVKVAADPTFRPDTDTPSWEGVEWAVPLMQRCWDAEPDTRPTFQEIDGIFKEHLTPGGEDGEEESVQKTGGDGKE